MTRKVLVYLLASPLLPLLLGMQVACVVLSVPMFLLWFWADIIDWAKGDPNWMAWEMTKEVIALPCTIWKETVSKV